MKSLNKRMAELQEGDYFYMEVEGTAEEVHRITARVTLRSRYPENLAGKLFSARSAAVVFGPLDTRVIVRVERLSERTI